MADSFGIKLGVEGEKEFKSALSDINLSFKVLGSEMKLVQSQFGKNYSSVESLTSRNEVLNRQIEKQKEKIATPKTALDNASSSFGENDRRTHNWQISLTMPRINCVLQLTAEFQRRLMHSLKAWKHKRAIMKTTSIHEMIGALRVCTMMRA